MNLILLHPENLTSATTAQLSERAHRHVQDVLRAKPGDEIRVGLINGRQGTAQILNSDTTTTISFNLTETSPRSLSLNLYLALPRPKALPRILQTVTTLGIKHITLMHAYRVEKAYWSCEQITSQQLEHACLLGLEQARDTVMPTITLERRFKPFVEDRLPALLQNTKALMGHPHTTTECPYNIEETISLAIGPEGGFIPYELDHLASAGFVAVKTFERILKVDAAITTMVGRLK